MPRRRGSTRGNSSAVNRRVASAGTRRNTRSRQPPSRYGHQPAQDLPSAISEDSETLQSNSEIMDASDQEYPGTPPRNSPVPDEGSPHTSTIVSSSPASRSSGGQNTIQTTASSSNIRISLHDMRILLQSHEQEILDRVVLRLSSNSHIQHPQNNFVPPLPDLRGHQPPRTEASQTRNIELESQLAQLREQEAHEQRIAKAPGALGMYNPTRDIAATISESASGMVELVETLFP